MGNINAIITGVAGYVPDYVLNNEELSRMVDTNDEWIVTRTGIKERRILTEEGLGTSYMARKAAKLLMKKTGADPDSIDALLVATTTPDYVHPSTASIVLGKLGLKNAFAFDFSAACCGFMYALDVACNMIQSGRHKRIIVIGADKMSSITDYQDRATCPLFGDGAGAVLVEATEEENIGLIDSFHRTDGKGLPFLHVKAGGSVCPSSHYSVDHRMHYTYQEGRFVFRYAVTAMGDDCEELLKRNHLTMDDVNYIIPHQASRALPLVMEKLGVAENQYLNLVTDYGNMVSVSVPFGLTYSLDHGLVKEGDVIYLMGTAAGMTVNMLALKL